MSGLRSYHAGLSAEESVARHYAAMGLRLAARRWRGTAGEIDLVFRQGAGLVFVEVKQSRDFERAAHHLTRRQAERIWATAAEFLGHEPAGQDTEARIDCALVDGAGRVRVIENLSLD